jgi:hypothetical protein
MKVQLLTFAGCPHAAATRERLGRVLTELSVAAVVEEIDVQAPRTPPSLARWPSPTVLLDGTDLQGSKPAAGAGCRLYPGGGAPDEGLIRQGVLRALSKEKRKDWTRGAANLGAALLSTLTCPACIGPYATLVSALGFGATYFSAAFMVVFPVSLLVSLVAIAHSTREHRSPWPLALTVVGGVVALAGQFTLQSDAVQRAGWPFLLAGAALNFWWVRRGRAIEVTS